MNCFIKFFSFGSLYFLIKGFFDLLVANIDTISFVLVSPSQEIALNVVFILFFKISFKTEKVDLHQ